MQSLEVVSTDAPTEVDTSLNFMQGYAEGVNPVAVAVGQVLAEMDVAHRADTRRSMTTQEAIMALARQHPAIQAVLYGEANRISGDGRAAAAEQEAERRAKRAVAQAAITSKVEAA